MRKLSAVAFVTITIMITALLPAIAYTQADADACTPDAMRLCASAIPDVSRVPFALPTTNSSSVPPAQPCSIVHGTSATRERRENTKKTSF